MNNKTLELLFDILTLAISTGLFGAVLTSLKNLANNKRNANLDFLIKLAFVIVNSLEQSGTIEARKAAATKAVNEALAKNNLTKRFPVERIEQVINLALQQSNKND